MLEPLKFYVRMPKFCKSTYVKDTAILTFGVVIANVVPLVAYPILSRLYTPEDFGHLSLLTSISALLSIIATLHYESAILITKNSKLAAELIIAIQIIALSFLFVAGLILISFSGIISSLLNAAKISSWLWICPICAYCIVVFNCYNEWCVKHSLFKSLSINKIINGSVLPLGKIVFYFLRSIGMFVGELAGQLITGISCLIRAFRSDSQYFCRPSVMHMLYLLKRYNKFPKNVLPGRLLNKVGLEIPIFLITAYFSAEELGYYSMAATLLVLPSKVIGKAISDTFRQKANSLINFQGNCSSFFKKVFLSLFLISLLSFSFLYLVAPIVFEIVLGVNWITAGYYCRILCFAMAIGLITDFGIGLYYIRERTDLFLYWQIFYFLLTLISMLIGVLVFKDMVSTLWCLVVARSIAYSVNGILCYSLSR